MSYQRISASTKDIIKKYYTRKVNKLDELIEERGKELSKDYINELYKSEAYKSFKISIINFSKWLKEVDSEDEFSGNYYVERLLDKIKDDSLFSKPYRSKLEDMYANDLQIKGWIEEKSNLNKECNKLLWNLEMSPKSSQEYKDALAKAENLLFSGDDNEE